jgi:hypothetical protein
MQGPSIKVNRLLARLIAKTTHTTAKKKVHLLRLVKDSLDLNVSGIC